VIYFLIYLFLEVFVSLSIASAIGVFFTFLEIIGSALLGMFILASYGNSSKELLLMLQKREISQEEFLANRLFSYAGAVLLIIPGFLTDIVGLLLQFEFMAKFFAGFVLKSKNIRTKSNRDSDDVIDVEIIERKDSE